jgi:hypothetical protein
MRIGSAIALIVLGAILSFAVADGIGGVDLTLIGYILMAAGALGLIASIIISRPRSLNRVSESRTLADPNTGETVHRTEVRDNGGV